MKRAIVLIYLVCASIINTVAQDIITLRSGEELKARIIHLNPKDVTFSPENSSDTLSLQRDEITRLHYKTGTIIYLSDNERPAISNEPVNDSLYMLGKKDAGIYYKGYKAAATGTLVTSLFIPFGLIPAIACSATPPSTNNLGYRDQQLIKNPSYYAGYTDQAYKIKKKKVWRNFGIGTGITVGYYLIMIAIVSTMLVY
jgi:hypothetical protein